jgi:hypothetical protein
MFLSVCAFFGPVTWALFRVKLSESSMATAKLEASTKFTYFFQFFPTAQSQVLICSCSMQNVPCSVYAHWKKAGVSGPPAEELFQGFVQNFGADAGRMLQILQSRHQPMSLKSYSTEASSIVWDDAWSIAKDDTRDPEGSKLVDRLAAELRRQNELKKKNTKFTDPFFSPTAGSLFVDPSRKFQDFLEGHYTGNIVWKRPSELFSDKEIKVFSGTISPDDVKQGLIGNCCKNR